MADSNFKTKVKVRSGEGPGSGSDVHEIIGKPKALARQVNKAFRAGDRFVTFKVPSEKKLAVITERVEAIWQE
jgi:hypothetical protein